MSALAGCVVLKFGGTSLATPERLRRVREIVERLGDRPTLVVVSAIDDTTDRLVHLIEAGIGRENGTVLEALRRRHFELARSVLSEEAADRFAAAWDGVAERLVGRLARLVSPAGNGRCKAADVLRGEILATGEDLSSRLVAAALGEGSRKALRVPAGRVVWTEDRVPEARADVTTTAKAARRVLGRILRRGLVAVVPGFVARTVAGRPTTLGRGGSDTTATLLGEALGAERVEIWTDVDGVGSADPRRVPGALRLPEIDLRTAWEMAAAGARVLCPASLAPARRSRVPILVRSIDRPEAPGTRILPEDPQGSDGGWGDLRAINLASGVVVLTVECGPDASVAAALAKLLAALDHDGRSPLALQVDAGSASLVLSERLRGLEQIVLPKGTEIRIESGLGLVTVVLAGRNRSYDAAREVLEEIGRLAPSLLSRDPRGRWLSFTVPADREVEVVQKLHRALVEERPAMPASFQREG